MALARPRSPWCVPLQNWGHQLYTWGWKKPATEWWEGAIKAVKQRFPNVVLLAEVYSPWQVRALTGYHHYAQSFM